LATTKLEFPARNVPMLPASGTFGHSRRGSGLPTSVPGVNLAPKSRASGRCRLERRYRISHGKKIQQRIDEITWYHEFDFGNGLRAVSKTPQVAGHRRIWSFIEGELDRIAFSSKAVLDIGCWDGYWSFYAERRGAKSVLASDDQTQNWAGSSGLMLAHRLLKSKVALDLERSVYDLAPLGRNFDIILCLGVYYHLVDPFYAFAQIRHCCHDDTIVLFEGDATRGLREDTLRYDLSNHSLPIFLPTEQTLGDMLRGAYLEPVRSTWMHPEPPPQPASKPIKRGRVDSAWRAAKLAFRESTPPKPDWATMPPFLPLNRLLTFCRPISGSNPMHAYRRPFGLDRYDDRFSGGWARRHSRPIED
jgi:tRNA (mo5U34)-methyltransferase